MGCMYRSAKESEKRVDQAIVACADGFEKLKLTSRILGCARQGCVVETATAHKVVKFTCDAGEATFSEWLRREQSGLVDRTPRMLPRVYGAYDLMDCSSDPAVDYIKFAVWREDLPDHGFEEGTPERYVLIGLFEALMTPSARAGTIKELGDIEGLDARLLRVEQLARMQVNHLSVVDNHPVGLERVHD